MTKLMNIAVMVIVGASFLFFGAQNAAGQSRWRRLRPPRPYKPAVTRPVDPPRYRPAYSAPYDYPQYTGAFHARYFDGIPSLYGTRPMRGTAW